MKKILSLLMIFVLALSCAAADGAPVVTDKALELSGNSVHYPQAEGLADAALQEKINRQLVDALGVENYLNRVAMLISSPVKLREITGKLPSPALSGDFRSRWM